MVAQVRRRFWIEASVGSIFILLFVATLVWPDWVELVFSVDPDFGSGAVEWMIVALSGIAAIMCFVLARIEWRRAYPITTS